MSRTPNDFGQDRDPDEEGATLLEELREDSLVRAITLEQIYPAYHRAEAFLMREDVVGFIVKKIGFTEYMSNKRITNYLSITSKLGIAEANGKNIDLRYFRPKRESVTAVLYFLFNSKLSPSATLRADDFKYLLLDERTSSLTLPIWILPVS